MRRLLLPLLCAITWTCAQSDQGDHQAEWRRVLEQKKAALAADATPDQKQVYADALSGFLRRHPNHGRAREVYHRIQLEFADELSSLGRYQDAIRFYRAVLTHDSNNEHARRGLSVAVERLAISREKLLQLEKGMSHRQVSQLLGKPIPGWTFENRRRDTFTEAWYYRTIGGGLAGVYFRDGKLFAAEENSQARFGL